MNDLIRSELQGIFLLFVACGHDLHDTAKALNISEKLAKSYIKAGALLVI